MGDALLDRSKEIQRLLEQVLPGYPVQSVVLAGEGSDHVAYEVNRELIVRFATAADRAGRARLVRTEARVLAAVKGFSPPAVPEPLLAVEDDGVLVYREIRGDTLLHLRSRLDRLDVPRFGESIGGFLSRLHAAPVSAFEEFAAADTPNPAEWLASAEQDYQQVIGAVPAALRDAIEAFLTESPPADPQVNACCHNDLGIEHILADTVTLAVTGIIDWADAAIADPACDLGPIYRDLGGAGLAAVLDHYRYPAGSRPSLEQRAEFYARCSVFEELAYGLLPGHDAYLAQSLSALPRLFAQSEARGGHGVGGT